MIKYIFKFICLLSVPVLFVACEQKDTTVTNPPGEKKTENNTTVIKESPAASTKTESNTTVNTGSSPGTSTSTSTTTGSTPNP